MEFKPPYNFEEGAMLLVNKPLDWTSFDVVNKLRWRIKKKTGHAGTLDPLATGLLMICTGKFTKRLQELQDLDKTYTGTIFLGGTTPTYDSEFEPETVVDVTHLTEEQIREAAASFVGDIQQTPPVYSALKVGGKPSHRRARAGKAIALEPRDVHIESLTINKIELPLIGFEITCSKGTYIRSLAFDLGEKLGVGGYLASLCRTRIGPYQLEDAWEIQELVDYIENEMQLKPGARDS